MENVSASITKWVGSATSVILHSLLFIVSFTLPYLGIVSFERMLLVLTTIVSLEAIYLSIFIQMSININNQSIEIIQEDIEELGEEIEEISGDIEEISEDIEEMQKDVDELGEDIEEIGEDIEEMQKDVDEIVDEIQEDEDEPETPHDTNTITDTDKKEHDLLLSIQATLLHLQKEIELLKNKN